MKDSLEKRVIFLFLVMLAVLVVVAMVAIGNIRESIASSDWVNHSHAKLLEVEGIVSSLHAGEAALRSYLLTSDARDLAACREQCAQMTEHLQVAQALARGEAGQQQPTVQLESLLAKRLEFISQVVKTQQQNGLEAARKLLAADAGGAALREIQRAAGKLKEEEMELLRKRDQASYVQAQTTRWTVLTGVISNFLLLAFVAWLIRDDLAARRRSAAALRTANEQLETKVQERTTQWVVANDALQLENLERQWANQALEHQLRYSQLIIHAIGDLILVLSKTQNILRLNHAVERQTGWESQDLVGNSLSLILAVSSQAPHSPPARDPVGSALNAGHELQEWPATLLHKSGRSTRVTFNLFPLRDGDKVVGGVISVRPPPVPSSPPASGESI